WASTPHTHRLPITFSATAGDVAEDVPMLVRIPADAFATLDTLPGADELDLRASDTGTQIPFDIDTWDPEGESLLWIRWPTLPEPGPVGHLYFGGTPETLPTGEVFPEPFLAVHHMSGPPFVDAS